MNRSSVGVPSTSMRYTYDASRGPSIEHEGPKYRMLGVVSIVNIAMCCYYSYIGGGCTNTSLSDKTNLPFGPTTPLAYLQSLKGLGIQTCPFTSMGEPNATGWYNPTATWEACMVNSNNPTGKMQSAFTTSMAFTGQQTLVYTWLAFAILYRSLCHYEWLLSTIAFNLYAILGVVGYYSFSPFLPYPHQTAATVASLTKYIKPDMYDDSYFTYDFCNGAETVIDESTNFTQRLCTQGSAVTMTSRNIEMTDCDKAYTFNLWFLVIQYISVFIVLCLLVIAFSAERIRRRYPLVNQLPPLKGTIGPTIIAVICLLSYAVMIFSKGSASLTTLSVMTDSDSPSSVFPFAQGSVDIATVFLIVTTMALSGERRGRRPAPSGSTVTAILHVSLVYPSIIGNLEVTLYNKIWTKGFGIVDTAAWATELTTPVEQTGFFGTGCRGFWNTYYLSFYNDASDPNLTNNVKDGNWVHPSPDQVDNLCWDTWISFVAQSVIFVLMHVQVVACSLVYKQNKGRPTDVYDPQPPTAPRDPRE
eukprot:CAMPEP_0118651738 /NCGR_PEP_ID=MMETSP0785-20121206/10942_1 /TAXON_ID=91992 /ORGANISM="Bolidomonas pacifica, Strain CCMP 1866" /LENGTH=529 /DNA_ID=CAMNT_0006544203 /DNA_START=35 /DNA_END=1622 /DNA_ORIENTATION=-